MSVSGPMNGMEPFWIWPICWLALAPAPSSAPAGAKEASISTENCLVVVVSDHKSN
jgi:hypothetical protein